MSKSEALVASIRETGVLPSDWNDRWLASVRNTIWKGLSDEQVMVAAAFCGRYKLDPYLKEVHIIQGNPFVGRDGFLTVSERHPRYVDHVTGQVYEDDSFIIEDGVAKHMVKSFGDRGKYLGAFCTVYTKDGHAQTFMRRPDDFKHLLSKDNWKKDLSGMVLIRTITHAFRNVFSLSNLYTVEEADEVLRADIITLPDTHQAVMADARLDELVGELGGSTGGEDEEQQESDSDDLGDGPVEPVAPSPPSLKAQFDLLIAQYNLGYDHAYGELMKVAKVDDKRKLKNEDYRRAVEDPDSFVRFVAPTMDLPI